MDFHNAACSCPKFFKKQTIVIRHVTLVTAKKYALGGKPSASYGGLGSSPGTLLETHAVNPELCETDLGRWLAEHILTTERNDEASLCHILMPGTNFGMHLQALSDLLGFGIKVDKPAGVRILELVQQWTIHRRRYLSVYGDANFELATIRYDWPVFDYEDAWGISTAEAFFDECAHDICATGGIVLAAGLNRAAPPEFIVQAMASGWGLELLGRYELQERKRSASFPIGEKTVTANNPPIEQTTQALWRRMREPLNPTGGSCQ